jgi:hypothetical protein
VRQLEDALDRDPQVNTVLAARLRRAQLQNGSPSQEQDLAPA